MLYVFNSIEIYFIAYDYYGIAIMIVMIDVLYRNRGRFFWPIHTSGLACCVEYLTNLNDHRAILLASRRYMTRLAK